MEPEFYDCLRTSCYVSSTIIKRNPIAVWPQLVKAERLDGTFIWQFYIEWNAGQRGHVNAARVCTMHHEVLLEYIGAEAIAETREQEVLEQWLMKHNSQMLAPL